MRDPFDRIRLTLTARLAALGPQPRWWQRRRRMAWKAAAAKAFAEAFKACAYEMAMLLAPVVVIGEPFVESPRSQQERARRILKGEVN